MNLSFALQAEGRSGEAGQGREAALSARDPPHPRARLEGGHMPFLIKTVSS